MNATPDDWRPLRAGGFMDHIGPLCAQRGAEGWRYALTTGPEHANTVGLVHGGVIAALLDHALSLVAWEAAGRVPLVTVQLDTRYLQAARPGARLEATARVRHATRSLMFMDAELCADGREIATAFAVMKLSVPHGGKDA